MGIQNGGYDHNCADNKLFVFYEHGLYNRTGKFTINQYKMARNDKNVKHNMYLQGKI